MLRRYLISWAEERYHGLDSVAIAISPSVLADNRDRIAKFVVHEPKLLTEYKGRHTEMSKKLCALVCAATLVAATATTTFGQDLLDQSFYDSLHADLNPTQMGFATDNVSLTSACCEPSCGSEDACGCGDGVGCGAGVGAGAAAGPSPCASSHKGLFYANDFSYLKDPKSNAFCLGDSLKLMPIAGGDFGTLDIGGQWRLRYHSEVGMGREGAANTQRFQDTINDFALTRLRLYANWKVNDMIRVYAEGIHAEASDDGGNYFPRGIDENRGDFLNLFVDVKLTDSFTARVGRQELLYGAQRTVSPLDWANTRRTFEGGKLIYNNGDWASDTFWTAFVPVDVDDFDEADYNRRFYGNYTTYRGFENLTVDGYYLGFDNQNANSSLHTVGMRVNGSMDNWLYEFEGAPQFGRNNGTNVGAGFATAGIGRKVKALPGGTTIWFYYDYASGDTGANDLNGYNQLFPLAHKYLGFIDAVQRTNIESPNILITMKPGKKWNFLLWYYHFMSNSADAVAGIGNTSLPQSNSKDLGDELDMILKYTICPRSNVLFGWSHFWRGNKLINATEDADFIYGQYTLNF